MIAVKSRRYRRCKRMARSRSQSAASRSLLCSPDVPPLNTVSGNSSATACLMVWTAVAFKTRYSYVARRAFNTCALLDSVTRHTPTTVVSAKVACRVESRSADPSTDTRCVLNIYDFVNVCSPALDYYYCRSSSGRSGWKIIVSDLNAAACIDCSYAWYTLGIFRFV